MLLLQDGRVCDERRVGDLLAEGLQDLLPVVVEVTLDLVDGLVLDDPQLTLGVTDQPLVVGDDDDATWRQGKTLMGLGERSRNANVRYRHWTATGVI